MTYLRILRWTMYLLVPVLTLGICDLYLIEEIGYEAPLPFYVIEASGLTPADVVGIILLLLAAPCVMRRRNRMDWIGFGILAAAVVVSGLYGLEKGASNDRALFEPSQWKTFVPLFAMAIAFNYAFELPVDRQRFLSWFCLVQVAFALYALCGFLLGEGQPAYYGISVPVFAGDMILFLIVAYAISFFRLVKHPNWRDALFTGVLAAVILLSLRRTFMAAVFSAPLLFVAHALVNWRQLLRSLRAVTLMTLAMIVTCAIFLYCALPADLVAGRFASINIMRAEREIDPIYGTMGHTNDFLDGLDLVRESPILGMGLGVWFPLARTSSWQDANVHAGIFKLWIKLGLLGVIGYFVLFGRGLLALRDFRRQDALISERLFVIWFALHFLLTSIYINTVLLGYKNSFLVAIFLCSANAVLSPRRSERTVPEPVASPIPAAVQRRVP